MLVAGTGGTHTLFSIKHFYTDLCRFKTCILLHSLVEIEVKVTQNTTYEPMYNKLTHLYLQFLCPDL